MRVNINELRKILTELKKYGDDVDIAILFNLIMEIKKGDPITKE
jgi:hypothetical protein